MNEVKIEGKVIKTSFDKRGFLRIRMAVLHTHSINGISDDAESFMTVYLPDVEKSKDWYVELMQNDYIRVYGHLKLDHSITNKDTPNAKHNSKDTLNVYVDKIEQVY